jgi:hypothetical protein
VTHPNPKNTVALDELTGGAFSAPTSGERAARVRAWLAGEPSHELIAEVFKELSLRDKGAAKALREKLDEQRRAKGQEALGAEWAAKAETLLATAKLNIADALAWQRDAQKAGAPLSKEPLNTLKAQLSERVKVIEDLQHRVQVQREAAVLLAQRIETLSMKPWRDAQGQWQAIGVDVGAWGQAADTLQGDANWPSVDAKFPPLLNASRAQLVVVWDAFQAALAQAVAASDDAAAVLPAVPGWAAEIRAARAGSEADAQTALQATKPAKPKVDPAEREAAQIAVREVLAKLEAEIAEGHGKASVGAANALRNALKDHGRLIGDRLDAQAHLALSAATELEGWQRWRADQIREDLVSKAEGLTHREPGQELGGRKMQEQLRHLREQWKQTDQGGAPNHGLWRRFDEACNQAHKVVEAWLEKIKAQAAEHRAQRLALIEEVTVWSAANQTALDADWKGFSRILHQFSDRWRDAGHLSEKEFAQIQPQWQAAIRAAAAPLEAEQALSMERRNALIAEAQALGAAPALRLDAVKALQQRWQHEAHAVPLDRKHEQKLWDAFRQPIDEAFNRKTAEREKALSSLSLRDRAVLDAAKALDAANGSGDAQAIRTAMAALDAAARIAEKKSEISDNQSQNNAIENIAQEVSQTPAAAPRKPVVAVRGDDRPGARRAEPAPSPGRGRPGDRPGKPGGFDRRPPRDGAELPRLGDAAFRAQREALDAAQLALKKLAARAHGEAVTQLLSAWRVRDGAQLPALAELGKAVTPAQRSQWAGAMSASPGDAAAGSQAAATALLRLEMASSQPTPAEHLDARRALQLQLLTRRNDPSPEQTWAQDVAQVFAAPHADTDAKRLQNALKVLLRN